MLKKYIVGNWKMNPGSVADAKKTFAGIAGKAGKYKGVEAVVCPPYPYLALFTKNPGVKLGAPASAGKLRLGAQDCHWEQEGAFTGSVSPVMVKGVGAKYVIIGHSERRKAGDTDEIINKKIQAALKEDLTVIFCVGEEIHDDGGAYLKDLQRQLMSGLAGVNKKYGNQLLVAHEPVWAIGAAAKGADTPESFQHNRLFIKKVLADLFGKKNGLLIPILYGGSANTKNAAEFLGAGAADGLLVGRASLSPVDFLKIMEIANNCQGQPLYKKC